jgi:hypothetical protein
MLRDTMLERVMKEQDGRLGQYAEEIAQHKRDPYTAWWRL